MAFRKKRFLPKKGGKYVKSLIDDTKVPMLIHLGPLMFPSISRFYRHQLTKMNLHNFK